MIKAQVTHAHVGLVNASMHALCISQKLARAIRWHGYHVGNRSMTATGTELQHVGISDKHCFDPARLFDTCCTDLEPGASKP